MTGKARNAVRTSAPESAKPEWVSIGMRLMAMRTGTNQETQAARLGVHKNTYARWERGEREIGADGLKRLVELGFDANWILTGEGEPVPGEVIVGAGAESTSQSLSETVLNIALELADESCRDAGVPKPVRLLYVKLVALLYEGLAQGLPVADVRRIGTSAAQEFFTGAITDDGKQEVGKSGPHGHGGHRGGRQEAG